MGTSAKEDGNAIVERQEQYFNYRHRFISDIHVHFLSSSISLILTEVHGCLGSFRHLVKTAEDCR